MFPDEHTKSENQKKVQNLYRKIRQRDLKDNDGRKIEIIIVNACIVIILLLYVLNALFDL
ncbi:hypothetical protein [Cytobacillus praedii]|uniref:hypothetical protein n=1 Tax=Cytobacillus praedii TaxID=1742358 RepID=UPI002E221AEF|nr:hypothetical protein [Cytobacillus praedii]